MNCDKIILYLVFFTVIYLLLRKTENMENTEEITALINTIYDADIESIRNLSKLANDLTNSNKLVVPGGLDIEGSFNLLPKGCIVAWNGTQADDGTVAAPDGWALCDGTNETPDLRGRFIRMATNDLPLNNANGEKHEYTITEGVNNGLHSHKRDKDNAFIDEHKFGQIGGSDYRNLTTAEMPAHNHSMQSSGAHEHALAGGDSYYLWTSRNKNSEGSGVERGAAQKKNLKDSSFKAKSAGSEHVHTINNTGSGTQFGLSSPYYVLVYIMKL
jgi:microcystin-dependent protein